MPYDISARGYLARAKQQLLHRSMRDSLFYAAFELRCCVEARQEEYATEIEYIKAKIKPWNIGATARQLEKMFDNSKIAKVTLSLENPESATLYHTPVSKRLYKSSEKLGELLHRLDKFRADDDPFWSQTRSRICMVYRDAWYSCQGQLLTPPLWSPKDKGIHTFKITTPSERLQQMLKQAGENKEPIKIKIAYLDEAPKEWVCDLTL